MKRVCSLVLKKHKVPKNVPMCWSLKPPAGEQQYFQFGFFAPTVAQRTKRELVNGRLIQIFATYF